MTRPVQMFRGAEKGSRYENPESAVAEEGLIRILYMDPELCRREELPEASFFSSDLLGRIYSCLREKAKCGENTDAAFLAGVLSSEESSALIRIIDQPVGKTNREQALRDYIDGINECQKQKEKPDLRAQAAKYKETKGYKG